MNLSLQLLTLFLLSAAGGPAHLPKPTMVPKPLNSQKENIEKPANHGDVVANALVLAGRRELSGKLVDDNAVSSNETALCVYPCKSSDKKIRKKRSVLQVISWTATLVNLACRAVEASRKTWFDFAIKNNQIKQLQLEINTYEEDLTEIKKRIPPKKKALEVTEANIKNAFKVFEYSRIQADAVATHYQKLIDGIKIYQDQKGIKNLRELLEKIKIESKALNETEKRRNPKNLDNEILIKTKLGVLGDFALEISGIVSLDLMDYFILPSLMEIIEQEILAESLTGAIVLASIGYKIHRIYDCITDQINLSKNLEKKYRETETHRDNLKKMYDTAKIALRDLDRIQKQLEATEIMLNAQTDKLVVFTNTFFEKLGNPCRTTAGSLETDISKLWKLVKHLKDDFDLRVEMESEKENLDNIKAYLPGEALNAYSGTTLAKLRPKFSHVDVDDLISKLTESGFSFPNERWSEWTTTQSNLTCSCEDKGQNTTCLVEETRTCLGQCVGPKNRTTDKCAIKIEDKFHFYKKCKSRDDSFRGKCIMTNTNKTRDNGEVLGRYVNLGISQKVCYEDCKKNGGAHGCEFRKTSCFLNKCKGDCFVINEAIEQGDNFTMASCYKFKSVTGKTEPLVLKSLLDSVQKAMTGDLEYNNNDFNDLIWAMLALDKNLLQSQENGWKQILEYQQSRNDSWGGNPSSYQEKNRTTLPISRIPPHNTNTSLVVMEPCNFASNIGYYHLMSSVTSLNWMNGTTKKALGQATAGLALSSSFFHGSHTILGQELDNLMIKIIVYILHQSYMDILDIPPESSPVLTKLSVAGDREMSGIEMAQFMTDMFEKVPSSEWSNQIENLDIPDYEITGSALILTLITNLGHTGYLVETGCKTMMSALGVSQSDNDFIMKQFLPEMKAQLDIKDMTWIEKPDLRNTVTTLLRMTLSFPYQETFNSFAINGLKYVIEKIFGEKSFDDINDKLTDRSTLPLIEPLKSSPGSGTTEEFPGKNWCFNSQPHSKWHLQSAKGLLDLFQLIDEIAEKQNDWKKYDLKIPIPQIPEIDVGFEKALPTLENTKKP